MDPPLYPSAIEVELHLDATDFLICDGSVLDPEYLAEMATRNLTDDLVVSPVVGTAAQGNPLLLNSHNCANPLARFETLGRLEIEVGR